MLGLKRHLPPFVVVARTDGAFPGYSVFFSKVLHYIMVTNIPLPNLTKNSKNPNSYGVSGGPIMIAFTLRTSTSRQATARAEIEDQSLRMSKIRVVHWRANVPTRTATFKLREE